MTDRPRTCTDSERLAQYADGRLQHPDCDEVETHLAICRACRDVLTDVTAFAQRERARLSSPAPDSHRYARAIDSLAPDERRVLIARHDDLANFADIAAALGVTTDHARTLFARAVMKLRLLLAQV